MRYVLSKGKCKTRLLGGFGKVLFLDGEVTNGQGILRDIALERARAILNGKGSSIGLVCRGSFCVVLCVQEAGN